MDSVHVYQHSTRLRRVAATGYVSPGLALPSPREKLRVVEGLHPLWFVDV